jgi:hypothetical protein
MESVLDTSCKSTLTWWGSKVYWLINDTHVPVHIKVSRFTEDVQTTTTTFWLLPTCIYSQLGSRVRGWVIHETKYPAPALQRAVRCFFCPALFFLSSCRCFSALHSSTCIFNSAKEHYNDFLLKKYFMSCFKSSAGSKSESSSYRRCHRPLA